MNNLVKILKEKHLSIGSVESMTGGLFASTLTSISGVSSIYKGSIVTYSIEEKIKLAHVDKLTIDEYGVVSEEVAIEMAEGGAEALNVDICVSVTGNAGPTCEPGDKPVGEVHIAVYNQGKTISRQLNLDGSRNVIRQKCVDEMVNLIKISLKN